MLQLERTARVADLGAGTGYFSVRIAKRVPEGKLFAVDIEPDMLRYLAERAHHEHLERACARAGECRTPNLPEPADLVLVVDTYHHIDNRIAYFAKLRTSLRPNGRLAIVDFKADAREGPPPEHRISPEKRPNRRTQRGRLLAGGNASIFAQAIFSGVSRQSVLNVALRPKVAPTYSMGFVADTAMKATPSVDLRPSRKSTWVRSCAAKAQGG